MKHSHEAKYYILILLLIALFLWAISYWGHPSELSDIVTALTALIAAVAFWMELKRSDNLNEATFIMEMNHQFISNPEMTKIEHALELYYNQVCEGTLNPVLGLELTRESPDCQSLVNYLVYMEGLAALVQRHVLHLGVIDDLFAYRFFLATNNPIVQEFELLPYAEFYRGCFILNKMWTKRWNQENRIIPLKSSCLCHCEDERKNSLVKRGDRVG